MAFKKSTKNIKSNTGEASSSRKVPLISKPKNITNLEWIDFKNHENIVIIVKAIEKRKNKRFRQEDWNLNYSIKMFLTFIRKELMNTWFAPDHANRELIDELLRYDITEEALKEEPLKKGETFEDIAEDIFQQWIAEKNTSDLIFLFERVRHAMHHGGSFLEQIYPDASIEFFDYLDNL